MNKELVTSKYIKTRKLVDSLGTRYHLEIMTDNGITASHASIGTYTDEGEAREMAHNAYAGCVEEYGMDNVYVTRDY